jgi:hypothetical protein
LAHCNIAYKNLEVFAVGRLLSRVAEIPVEDPDLLPSPAERLRLGRQIILTFLAFLIEADLAQFIMIGSFRVGQRGAPSAIGFNHVGDDGARLDEVERCNGRIHLVQTLAAAQKLGIDRTNLVQHLL